ncbi:MAG: outer membrane beta-barrel protein [Melioribacteraceae bacterium]|nr:outer membrane beta-barrel protein [Melioribacteraceae bacterium]
MKSKSFFLLVIFVLIILNKNCFSQDKLKYGTIGGIGFWRFMPLTNNPNTGSTPDFLYPLGFSIGFYLENKLSPNFSVVNELLYQNCIAGVTISTAIEGILDQKVTTQFLKLPILLKYQTPYLWNTYLYLGPSFAYLIKANYIFSDQAYSYYKGNVDITKNLPTISVSIEFGLGKELVFSDKNFMFELRVQLGITRFQYKEILNYYEIGQWRNSGIVLLIGLQL